MKLWNTGEFPIIGVNTFLSSKDLQQLFLLSYSCDWRRETIQIQTLNLHKANAETSSMQLDNIQDAAIKTKIYSIT
jgi:hypothetical protein